MNKQVWEQAFGEIPDDLLTEALEAPGKETRSRRGVLFTVGKIAACVVLLAGVLAFSGIRAGRNRPADATTGVGILTVRALTEKEWAESLPEGSLPEPGTFGDGLLLMLSSEHFVEGAEVRYVVTSDGALLGCRGEDGAAKSKGTTVTVPEGTDVLWMPETQAGGEFSGEKDYVTVLIREGGAVTGVSVLCISRGKDGGWNAFLTDSRSFPRNESGYQEVPEEQVSRIAEDAKTEERVLFVPDSPEESPLSVVPAAEIAVNRKAALQYTASAQPDIYGANPLQTPAFFALGGNGKFYCAVNGRDGGLFGISENRFLVSFASLGTEETGIAGLLYAENAVWMLLSDGELIRYEPETGKTEVLTAVAEMLSGSGNKGALGLVLADGKPVIRTLRGYYTADAKQIGKGSVAGENRDETSVLLPCGKGNIELPIRSDVNQTFAGLSGGGVAEICTGTFAVGWKTVAWTSVAAYADDGNLRGRILYRVETCDDMVVFARAKVGDAEIQRFHVGQLTIGTEKFDDVVFASPFTGADGTVFLAVGTIDRLRILRLDGHTGQTADELRECILHPEKNCPAVPVSAVFPDGEAPAAVLCGQGSGKPDGKAVYCVGPPGTVLRFDGKTLVDLRENKVLFVTAEHIAYARLNAVDIVCANGTAYCLLDNGISLVYSFGTEKVTVRDEVRRHFKMTRGFEEIPSSYYFAAGMKVPYVVTEQAKSSGERLFDLYGRIVTDDVLLVPYGDGVQHFGGKSVRLDGVSDGDCVLQNDGSLAVVRFRNDIDGLHTRHFCFGTDGKPIRWYEEVRDTDGVTRIGGVSFDGACAVRAVGNGTSWFFVAEYPDGWKVYSVTP